MIFQNNMNNMEPKGMANRTLKITIQSVSKQDNNI